MPNIILVTTMWGDVPMEKGEQREQELKRNFWKDMLADGCRMERFEDTWESAWGIVGNLTEKVQFPSHTHQTLSVISPQRSNSPPRVADLPPAITVPTLIGSTETKVLEGVAWYDNTVMDRENDIIIL
jgi:hypothetical protein